MSLYHVRVAGDKNWPNTIEAESHEQAVEIAAEQFHNAGGTDDDSWDFDVKLLEDNEASRKSFSVGRQVKVTFIARTLHSDPNQISKPRAQGTQKFEGALPGSPAPSLTLSPANPPPENAEEQKTLQSLDDKALTEDDLEPEELEPAKKDKKGGKAETSKASANDFVSKK